jgi:hypothetical protein
MASVLKLKSRLELIEPSREYISGRNEICGPASEACRVRCMSEMTGLA